MNGVIEVNVAFAREYSALQASDPSNVQGINYAPVTPFNPGGLPTLNGKPVRDPRFRNRIIGSVNLHTARRDRDEDRDRDVHGGATAFPGAPVNTTITGDNVRLGSDAVFFRSRIGNNSRVGSRSLVQQSDLGPNTVIPDRKVVVVGIVVGDVEW